MKKITTSSLQHLIENCTAAAKSGSNFFNLLVKRPDEKNAADNGKILRGKILRHRLSHKNDIFL